MHAKSSLITIALAGLATQQAVAAPVAANQKQVAGRPQKAVTYWRYHPEDPPKGKKLNARASTVWRYHPGPKPTSANTHAKRGWWEKVKGGIEDFGEGFVDGFNSEQAGDYAPEEGHSKRSAPAKQPKTVWRYHPGPPPQQAGPAHAKRGWWEKVKGGFEDFGEGFVDGFNSEQDADLAPEEGHDKRGFFDDIGNGLKQGFDNVGDDIEQGYHRIIHPVVLDARDSFWDDLGNGVGAFAGWGQDHIGRISFKREDDEAEKRGFWDSVEDVADDVGDTVSDGAKKVGTVVVKDAKQFGNGFVDGYKAEQKGDFAPEEGHGKRGALDDIGHDIKQNFIQMGDDLKEDYQKLIHPDVERRDSFWDDLGNGVGAFAGWGQDHIGRIDPSSIIFKGKGRRDVNDADLLG